MHGHLNVKFVKNEWSCAPTNPIRLHGMLPKNIHRIHNKQTQTLHVEYWTYYRTKITNMATIPNFEVIRPLSSKKYTLQYEEFYKNNRKGP